MSASAATTQTGTQGRQRRNVLNLEDAASLGVPLTNLDEPLFDEAGATKRVVATALQLRKVS
jgi:hypothetical protein